jgi:hypothetical protein
MAAKSAGPDILSRRRLAAKAGVKKSGNKKWELKVPVKVPCRKNPANVRSSLWRRASLC